MRRTIIKARSILAVSALFLSVLSIKAQDEGFTMTIELQNEAKISINTNEIKDIRFTEGKIVIADLDFKESIQSILDSLALYSHQSIEMFMSNQMEICDLQFKADSLTDNYYEMRDRISGLSDSIKLLDYESRLNCWVLYDSIAVLNLKIDALSDRLLGMSDSVKLLAYKMYEDVYESINRDEYLIQQIDTLFNRSQKDHNYEEWSGVKSFYIYDDWGNKEYNYNWDGRYDNDWW